MAEEVKQASEASATSVIETPNKASDSNPVDSPVKENDPGLGLDGFLRRKPESQVEDKKTETPVKVESKTETGVKAKTKVEVKAEPAQAPSVNWDDDNNPWKKKSAEFDQRFRDTQRSRSELERQIAEERQQRVILQKKFDGTYDPQVDDPKPPDIDAVRQWGTIEGKAQASLASAIRTHGQDKTMQALEKYAQIFANDRPLQERILLSDDPVQAAMDALSGYEFFKTYGNDPGAIVDKIRKQMEIELGPKIAEREAKRIQQELAGNRGEPRGIGKVLGTSGIAEKQVTRDNAGRQKRLNEVFPFGR